MVGRTEHPSRGGQRRRRHDSADVDLAFLDAIYSKNTRFTASIDGLRGGGKTPYQKVMSAVQQGVGMGDRASPLNWELAQLYQAKLLGFVDFVSQGMMIKNPFK